MKRADISWMGRENIDNLKKTLDTTLESFLELVQCDAGSVFTVRKNGEGRQILRFEAMITRSINLGGVPEQLRSLQFEIDDSSIVGKTAVQRKSILLNLILRDGQALSCVDKILNYATRNILSGPLVTPRGDLVGVVQLLNKLPQDGTPFNPRDTSRLPDFDDRDDRLFSIIAGQAALAIENSLLLDEQERLIEGFVNACVTAIEARDPVTSGHSMRVSNYTVGLAEAVNRTDVGPLRDILFTPAQLRELRFASMLHDVGKVALSDRVLQKPGPLSDEERREVEQHSVTGAAIVARIEGLEPIVPWIRHSHEHYDGSGYPDGLAGEAIPSASRIMLVADAFDVMCSSRPYQRARGMAEAVEELRRCAGTQFDPRCVEVLEDVVDALRRAQMA